MRAKMMLAALLSLLLPAFADPNALWKIVHGRCVPDMLAHHDPAPCASVDLIHRAALMKDRDGIAQYLLIPTDPVRGIDDPALLAPGAPDYWHLAWQARGAMMALGPHGIQDRAVSLAINPAWGRTQFQMHIHIDCTKASVLARLSEQPFGSEWRAVTLDGKDFVARRFAAQDNAFALLARYAASQHSTMADWSMASVGPDLLLATRAEPAEKIQDLKCRE